MLETECYELGNKAIHFHVRDRMARIRQQYSPCWRPDVMMQAALLSMLETRCYYVDNNTLHVRDRMLRFRQRYSPCWRSDITI